MTKNDLKKYEFGSVEYVVMHAKWKKSRGKHPSASFGSVNNPRRALLFARVLCKSSIYEDCPRYEDPILHKKEEEVDFLLKGLSLFASLLGGGGDQNNLFPSSDADELSRGARFIPGEVTLARRAGQKVTFVQQCGPCCWYWQMPDGSKIYHWDRSEYQRIATKNGKTKSDEEAGACPRCGNINTIGGIVKKLSGVSTSETEIRSRYSNRVQQFMNGTGDW